MPIVWVWFLLGYFYQFQDNSFNQCCVSWCFVECLIIRVKFSSSVFSFTLNVRDPILPTGYIISFLSCLLWKDGNSRKFNKSFRIVLTHAWQHDCTILHDMCDDVISNIPPRSISNKTLLLRKELSVLPLPLHNHRSSLWRCNLGVSDLFKALNFLNYEVDLKNGWPNVWFTAVSVKKI